MNILLSALLAVGATLAASAVNRWASQRADRVRRFSADDADRLEHLRISGRRLMRIPGFDKPR